MLPGGWALARVTAPNSRKTLRGRLSELHFTDTNKEAISDLPKATRRMTMPLF